jgi:hypothetical protein
MRVSADLSAVVLKSASVIVPVRLNLRREGVDVGGLGRCLVSCHTRLRRIRREGTRRRVIPIRFGGGTDRHVATRESHRARPALTVTDGVALGNLPQKGGAVGIGANLDCPLGVAETPELENLSPNGTLGCLNAPLHL